MKFAKAISKWMLDILFPVPELPENLEINQTLFCPVCRARLANNVKICHKTSQYKLGAAIGYDNDAIRKLVWQLKYRNRSGNAAPLGNLLNQYLANLNLSIKNYIIIPIPLSQKRLRDRGFNQAELIAKHITSEFKLPLANQVLVRQKNSKPQAEMSGWDERRKNIKNCFGIANPLAIKGRNIILIDDVFTSGATMAEAAHALKDFGAKQVLGLVVAKAG